MQELSRGILGTVLVLTKWVRAHGRGVWMRGRSLNWDHQTPLDVFGETVRSLGAGEQQLSQGQELLQDVNVCLCATSASFSPPHTFLTVEFQGLSLTTKMEISPALSPVGPQQYDKGGFREPDR